MIALGLKDLGYNYVLQDDCWSAGRNSSGYLQADPTKFPHGMAYVADNLHGMGLGFGIYSDAGTLTCAQYEGSLGHETVDAQTWASWGVSASNSFILYVCISVMSLFSEDFPFCFSLSSLPLRSTM